MSIAELQDRRNQRAAAEKANYSFRLSSVNGQALVFVTNIKTGEGYSVNALKRCNCKDFQERCAKVEGLRCKHVVMVDAWLSDCSVPELPEAGEAPAQTCGECGEPKEGRLCPTCGSRAVVTPEPTPSADEARAARKRDLLALWP